MSWDIATARQVAGVTAGDTTHDAALQRVMDIVLAEVEGRLERGLFSKRVVEKYYSVTGRIYVERYPISTVHSPTDGNVQVHCREGWIACLSGREVAVDYTGGYVTLPSDLEAALWGIFLAMWGTVDPMTGFPTAAGAALIQGSGDVKKVTVFDAYAVEYDVGTTSAGGGNQQSGSVNQAFWGALSPWASTLMRYRRNVGGA